MTEQQIAATIGRLRRESRRAKTLEDWERLHARRRALLARVSRLAYLERHSAEPLRRAA